MKKKIGIVVGTRPEIIKLASVIRECKKRSVDFILIHSNQHYSENMDKIFFNSLNISPADYNLRVGSGTHASQTAHILTELEPILKKEKVDVIIVQGDTNTTFASSLTASKLKIKIAHVEAGLRSYDRDMPEETNRVLTDHMSDYLFAVSEIQKENLNKEGISHKKIYVVGNTIVDELLTSSESKAELEDIHELLCANEYFLLTAHRPSNVDDAQSLNELLALCEALAAQYNKKIVWPVHPRTIDKIKKIKLKNFILLEPQGYFDFLALLKNSFSVLTDSGGIQEEACILQVPCLTLRENTERPESIEVGANILVGRDINKALAAVKEFKNKKTNWKNPFGDGKTAEKILDIILK